MIVESSSFKAWSVCALISILFVNYSNLAHDRVCLQSFMLSLFLPWTFRTEYRRHQYQYFYLSGSLVRIVHRHNYKTESLVNSGRWEPRIKTLGIRNSLIAILQHWLSHVEIMSWILSAGHATTHVYESRITDELTRSNGLYTLHGTRTGTGTGNGMGTIENNDSLCLSLCSLYIT